MDAVALSWSVLGISIGGFFFLASWIRNVTDASIVKELKEIKAALVGDMEKPGIIAKLYEHDREIKIIKDVCREKHPLNFAGKHE